MVQHTPDVAHRPHARARWGSDHGSAVVQLVGAAVALVVLAVGAFLVMGTVLADADDEPFEVPVREGRLSEAAYESVELGARKEQVLTAFRPVLPVDTRVIDRFELREPETVAAECVYYDREDGRAGQQYRFCFADDVLVDKTVLLAGDPGEGSAVVEDAEL